jgi:membrane protease YdiL (CAAX protease family)
MKKVIERHQISIFFILAFVLSWYPWYAGIAADVLIIGPSLAAFIVVLIVSGKRGFINLLRPFIRSRAGLLWWGIAVFGMAGIFLIGLGAHLVLGGEAPPFIMIREELNLIPLYLMVVLMPWNGPVGEEFGWRGFALPKLQSTYGPLVASLVIGVIWGIWHLPTFFAPLGVLSALTTALGIGFILPYTITTIASSIFMTWLYNKTQKSALIAGVVWHASTDFWAPIILSDSSLVAAQEGTHLPTIPPTLYLTVATVLAVSAGIVVIATKGRLGFEKSESLG